MPAKHGMRPGPQQDPPEILRRHLVSAQIHPRTAAPLQLGALAAVRAAILCEFRPVSQGPVRWRSWAGIFLQCLRLAELKPTKHPLLLPVAFQPAAPPPPAPPLALPELLPAWRMGRARVHRPGMRLASVLPLMPPLPPSISSRILQQTPPCLRRPLCNISSSILDARLALLRCCTLPARAAR